MSTRTRLHIKVPVEDAMALAHKAWAWFLHLGDDYNSEIAPGVQIVEVRQGNVLHEDLWSAEFVFKWGGRYFRNIHDFFAVDGDFLAPDDTRLYTQRLSHVRFIEVFPETVKRTVYR